MDLCHLLVSSKSSSNYPGLSFTGRWHDPEAHAGLASCVSETGLRITGAPSLSSSLVAPSEQGDKANWEPLGSSKLIAEAGKALMWATCPHQQASTADLRLVLSPGTGTTLDSLHH